MTPTPHPAARPQAVELARRVLRIEADAVAARVAVEISVAGFFDDTAT